MWPANSRAIRLLAVQANSAAACRPDRASTGASRTAMPSRRASSGTVSTSRPNEQLSQSRWKVSACTTHAGRVAVADRAAGGVHDDLGEGAFMVETADAEERGRGGADPGEGGALAGVAVGVDPDAGCAVVGVELDESEHLRRPRGSRGGSSPGGTDRAARSVHSLRCVYEKRAPVR